MIVPTKMIVLRDEVEAMALQLQTSPDHSEQMLGKAWMDLVLGFDEGASEIHRWTEKKITDVME